MSTFTVTGVGDATFTATEQGFSDRAGLLEEWAVTLIIDNDFEWGALFALLTPKELVSVRACRGAASTPPTVSIDIGGGPGVGTVVIDDLLPTGTHEALLVELSSEAAVTDNGPRIAKVTFQIVD